MGKVTNTGKDNGSKIEDLMGSRNNRRFSTYIGHHALNRAYIANASANNSNVHEKARARYAGRSYRWRLREYE
jgi:NurA-like 5'-3' nuclease